MTADLFQWLWNILRVHAVPFSEWPMSVVGTYSPSKPGRPSGPRVRYQRSYSPRVVGGKVITPADLRRLHKYMLEIEKVAVISDERRAVVESEWPELAHKLPPRR